MDHGKIFSRCAQGRTPDRVFIDDQAMKLRAAPLQGIIPRGAKGTSSRCTCLSWFRRAERCVHLAIFEAGVRTIWFTASAYAQSCLREWRSRRRNGEVGDATRWARASNVIEKKSSDRRATKRG
jgi:hypothetical protein